MQLRAFAKLLATWRALGAPAPRPTLIVAGAVRHTDDQRRLDGLRALWAQLSSEGGATDDDVESVVFAPNLIDPPTTMPPLMAYELNGRVCTFLARLLEEASKAGAGAVALQ